MPTLIVAGELDCVVPGHHARLLHREIPGAMLNVAPGAGHTLIWTDPDKPVEAVRHWE
jgi:pimeloyl-ACP methyl ester carboxylesterase